MNAKKDNEYLHITYVMYIWLAEKLNFKKFLHIAIREILEMKFC